MKHIFQLALFVLLVGTYSCHSSAKKSMAHTRRIVAKNLPNSHISANPTSQESNDRDTSSQPLMTKLIFTDFSVKVINSAFGYTYGDNNKIIYSGDTITNKVDIGDYRMWKLTTKDDSVRLFTDDGNGLDIGTIEILPNNKTDRFEISYSFEIPIIAAHGKDSVLWESMAPYKKIKDSLTYFFKAPEHNNMYAEMGSQIKEIKQELKLKDTTFKKQADNYDYGTYDAQGVIFKNRLCEIDYTTIIYLKIDRFVQNKLHETKYLLVDFSIPE
jgi:hypothetical protein